MKSLVSFYKFVSLDNLPELRSALFNQAQRLKIKGTILLAPEGINGMLSGDPEGIHQFCAFLRADKRFEDLWFKESEHAEAAFSRLLVKVKKEIITMNRPEVDPTVATGKRLSAEDLLSWFRSGREFTIVDTRNDYEVAAGTFRGAINPDIKSFSEFPTWVDENLADARNQPVVTFCTGGVRCEKATAYMQDQGFSDVYQVDGGIISYLEKTRDADENYWDGDCVVFDRRKAVDKDLRPSSKSYCYVCLAQSDLDDHERCQDCSERMAVSQQERDLKGEKKQEQFWTRRAEFLQEMRQKWA